MQATTRLILATLVVASLAPARSASAEGSFGPNLTENSSVEARDSGSGSAAGWFQNAAGTNAYSFVYPIPGYNSPKGLQVAMSRYTNGSASWYFKSVPVTGGDWYEFSDAYQANLPSDWKVWFRRANGTIIDTKVFAALCPKGSYTRAAARVIAPPDAATASVEHRIRGVGELRTDEFSLRRVLSDTANLLPNPGFEQATPTGLPVNWKQGRWGTHTAVFSYPVEGVEGTRAAKVAITSYTSGDAKWYVPPTALPRGVYTGSITYKSTVPTVVTMQVQNPDNTLKFKDLAAVPPAGTFVTGNVDFWVPMNAKTVTVFHLLNRVGELTSDNASLVFKAAPSGIFEHGAVSLSFDDGWLSQYEVALPKLASVAMKATFYIVTKRMAEQGYPGFITQAQLREIYSQGHEIGAHSRTHRDLSKLSPEEQRDEILGSKQDLAAMGIDPVAGFAYPFGAYTSTTLQLTQDAGYTNARATIGGSVVPITDEHQLPRFSVERTTTFEQVKQAIDTTVANKEWLILVIHQIKDGPDRYMVPPAVFHQIVEYLSQIGTRVMPVSEGIASML